MYSYVVYLVVAWSASERCLVYLRVTDLFRLNRALNAKKAYEVLESVLAEEDDLNKAWQAHFFPRCRADLADERSDEQQHRCRLVRRQLRRDVQQDQGGAPSFPLALHLTNVRRRTLLVECSTPTPCALFLISRGRGSD